MYFYGSTGITQSLILVSLIKFVEMAVMRLTVRDDDDFSTERT
jgi:hypothetical protein